MRPVARNVKPRVLEALQDTRVVAIQGARQVGKTTRVGEVVGELGGRLETLDDEPARIGAAEDPVGFLNQYPDRLLAIDEVQRVPQLILALKLVVDRDPRPGRFLVTGSTDLVRLPTAQDSLAGRVEGIELHGFSQGELAGRSERFIERLLAGDRFEGYSSSLSRNDYLARATAGGYPEAVQRGDGRRRDLWLDNYIGRIIERDAIEISDLQRLNELPLILKLLAARNSGELTLASLARDAAIPVRTLGPCLDLLEALSLIQRLPAWSTNRIKRAILRPKVSLLDSGLAVRLLNVSDRGAIGEQAGGILEGLVAGELRRQLAWSEVQVQISHYRDPDAGEVDLVLETPDGRVAGLEIKSAATVSRRDTRGLARLRKVLGPHLVGGLILHTGERTVQLGDRIAAAPLDVFWTT